MPGADRPALLGSTLPDSEHTFAADCGPLLLAAVVLERTPLLSRDLEKRFVDTT